MPASYYNVSPTIALGGGYIDLILYTAASYNRSNFRTGLISSRTDLYCALLLKTKLSDVIDLIYMLACHSCSVSWCHAQTHTSVSRQSTCKSHQPAWNQTKIPEFLKTPRERNMLLFQCYAENIISIKGTSGLYCHCSNFWVILQPKMDPILFVSFLTTGYIYYIH